MLFIKQYERGVKCVKFYASSISDNIAKTPENFLICRNVPIARIGMQEYTEREIDEDGDPNKRIKVYRLEEDVFAPEAIASFEGKPLTEDHPIGGVDSENVRRYAIGTATNVRRGKGEDADKLIADLIVYNESQIEKIESSQKREISCGYECDLEPYEDGYKQINIIGNHVALVNNARAGSGIAIKDEKGEQMNTEAKTGGYKLPKRRKSTASTFLKAIGAHVFAKDAEPEEVLQMIEELVDEEVNNISDEETTTEVKEEITKDSELDALKEKIAELEAMIAALTKDSDEEVTETSVIDELIEELTTEDSCTKDEDESEIIEETKTADEDITEETKIKASDSAVEILKIVKPLIAGMADTKQRKQLTDSISDVVRKSIKDSKPKPKAKKDQSKNVYSRILSGDSADTPEYIDLGMEVAKKFNPHYQEVK